MKIDKRFCMSSFLMFRALLEKNISFDNTLEPFLPDDSFSREPVGNSRELLRVLKRKVQLATQNGEAALALSGGMDSAILAKLAPKGTVAYTFKCVVEGKNVVDETERAAYYAEKCGLEHRIVEIYWNDYKKFSPVLMRHKGAPIHSIEVQIYKAALRAKQDGFSKLIFGENADIIYGGMDGLLKKDWLFGEFVERYAYILPYKALKEPQMILEPFIKYEKEGHIDGYEFINEYFRREALGTYINACNTADIQFIGPYSETYLSKQIDYSRIRAGDTKYLVREVYRFLYPDSRIPHKIPMPRPMEEWLALWEGPKRAEFWPDCHKNMTGDQKWMLFILEMFLNCLDMEWQ